MQKNNFKSLNLRNRHCRKVNKQKKQDSNQNHPAYLPSDANKSNETKIKQVSKFYYFKAIL